MSLPIQYKHTVAARLMHYVKIDTEADPNSMTQPSSLKQLQLGELLVNELLSLGVEEAEMDAYGYVYATIPATTDKKVPVLCFCSHMDTSPDVTGRGVKPVLHKNFDGTPIRFADDPDLVLSMEEHPYLKEKIGEDIITASGQTLLGADDKAGIAIIMDFVQFLCENPQIPHGVIKVLFTPDEEIGRGVDAIDMLRLGADFGYTLDGGQRGVLEGESFSADACEIVFHGISAHPGYAKNKMVSALKVAAHFLDLLPKDTLCPEKTSGMEGFVHPLHMEGTIEKATVKCILRDFATQQLDNHFDLVCKTAQSAVKAFPGASFSTERVEQYRNMKEVLDEYPEVMENAMQAYRFAGLEPRLESIRGGTDGSRLSFMGLPCPNIFTGEMAIHSRVEYVSVQDMEKAVEVLHHLCQIYLEKA